MKVFNNREFQYFLNKIMINYARGVLCDEVDLRFCRARLRAGYRPKSGDFWVILRSYNHDTIALICDKSGGVRWAVFYPYRSVTTWQHVRKFCALFQNGRELYCAYSKAAHGGKITIDL